jgi:DNA repair exonuclease SbcCD ATPase subunit
VQYLDGEIRRARAKLDEERTIAAKREAVEQAASQVTSLRTTLEELEQRKGMTEQATHAAAAAIQEEINALPPLAPEDAAQFAATALQKAEQAANDAARTVEQTNAQIATLQAEADTTRRQLEQSASVKAEAERLNHEIAEWTLLAAALLGVIDLSIEDAGPAIAAHANNLLREAYGPRFTCRIVTQKQQANGRMVETFDISVIDAETGIESSILRKSGGETVWLDKAMRDAVGLYHQEAAGVHYECLFADEAEDGLTEERKEQFYRMDRAALDLGGYRRKFFISHNPRAWEMADHVINLAEYREAH